MIFLAILSFAFGLWIVLVTLAAAAKTFVLPRAAPVRLTALLFLGIRWLLNLWLRRSRTYIERDALMALYAPIALLALPLFWLTLVLIGYMGMYWALGIRPWSEAFLVSGSSLLTLGFAPVSTLPQIVLAFSQAMIGLGLVALLIAYLPTMYNAFAKREAAVTLLEVYAGSPPSAIELISRVHRIHGPGYLGELWSAWEIWFAEIEESHTSFTALNFFRSQKPERSWVTAAGAVLDAASLTLSTVDQPYDPRAALCIRAGYLALRSIASFFRIPFNPDPEATDQISISRAEFDIACEQLASQGAPLVPDRDRAWRDYAGWRVNYDIPLLALAALTMAPPAHWSSDRAELPRDTPRLLYHIVWKNRGEAHQYDPS